MKLNILSIVFIIGSITFLTYTSTPADAGTPSGYWTGAWTSTAYPGQSDAITANLTRTGINVTGTISITTVDCGRLTTQMAGSVEGSGITLRGTFYCGGTSIPSTIVIPSDMSNTETGYYAIYYSNGTLYDQGTWRLTRQTPATVTITASATRGAIISPNGTVTIDYKDSQYFTISAESGYSLTDTIVNGSSIGARSNYTFTSVTSSKTIQAIATQNTPPEPLPTVNVSPIIQLLLAE